MAKQILLFKPRQIHKLVCTHSPHCHANKSARAYTTDYRIGLPKPLQNWFPVSATSLQALLCVLQVFRHSTRGCDSSMPVPSFCLFARVFTAGTCCRATFTDVRKSLCVSSSCTINLPYVYKASRPCCPLLWGTSLKINQKNNSSCPWIFQGASSNSTWPCTKITLKLPTLICKTCQQDPCCLISSCSLTNPQACGD